MKPGFIKGNFLEMTNPKIRKAYTIYEKKNRFLHIKLREITDAKLKYKDPKDRLEANRQKTAIKEKNELRNKLNEQRNKLIEELKEKIKKIEFDRVTDRSIRQEKQLVAQLSKINSSAYQDLLLNIFNKMDDIYDEVQINHSVRLSYLDYIKEKKWKKVDMSNFEWVSIQNFWCVNGKYLSRKNFNESSFNKVLGSNEPKNQASQTPSDKMSKWLAGSQKESKKVFSFKNPPRTFGFVNPDIITLDQMKERLENVWGKENDTWKFIKGDYILKELLGD